MPDQRSPRDAILDVLASAKVKSTFALEEIAESIMHALAIAGADRQPNPAPTRIPVQAIKIIEKVQYSIDVYDAGGNLLEVLGRLSRLDMARAAQPGLCRTSTSPAVSSQRPSRAHRHLCRGDAGALTAQFRAQEGDGMAAQGQPHMAVIFDNLTTGRHRPQCHDRLMELGD